MSLFESLGDEDPGGESFEKMFERFGRMKGNSVITVFTLRIRTPTFPKIGNSPFYLLLMCLKYCCVYGKQCSPRSDAAFHGI